MMIFNTTAIFKPASEPTNIIWENIHIKGCNFVLRVIGVLLILGFMMLISFAAIFWAKKYQIRNQENWPVVNCEQLIDQYNSS